MPQRHLDVLTAVDAAFLHQEGAANHMHIGGVALVEGPVPDLADVREHVRGRLHLVPRYRQKLATPPAGLGRPRWVDDPTFNLSYHVRHTALPRPGDRDRLERLVARLFANKLDRGKPLWELWIVEGLADGRFAIISKAHHALVDGMAGVDLTSTLFDLDREPYDAGEDPWQPLPEPSTAQLTATALGGAAKRLLDLPLRAAEAVSRPGEALEAARETAGALGEVALAGLSPAPRTPLNVKISPARRFRAVPADLADLKRIKDAFGGTVNDVVLAVVAGALRRWLHERGIRTAGLEPRACVPVSVRTADDIGSFGNRLSQVVVPLPVDVADPVERLEQVAAAMRGVKESRQALGAEVIAGMQDFAPPTILAQASRLNFSTRLYNLLVTNIPGPQFPLFFLGRRLEEVYPVAFLAGDRALAVAIMSYDGRMGFGLLADYDAMPDLDAVAAGVDASIAELLALAGRRSGRRGRPGPVGV